MATDLNQPRVFKTSRLAGFGLLFWLGLAAMWRWRGKADWDPQANWLEAALWIAGFAYCLAAGTFGALFPARLTYGPQGISWGRFGKRRRLAWAEVEGFKVISAGVGFDYADSYRPAERQGRRFDRSNKGWDARLPGGLGVDPRELAGQLNEARRRWTA